MFCGTVSVSACWLGVCTEGCQLSPCSSLYIIVILDSVSLTVCLWCSVDCEFSWTTVALLHHFRFVDVLFGCGVPDDRSVFKCWSNKGLIMFSMI